MDKKLVFYIFVCAILSFCIIQFSSVNAKNTPKEVYRIYLKGESLGLIESKDELEKYIDTKQDSIKKKYGVNKVYIPEDLDIIKEITYHGKVLSIKEIYEKIEKKSPFTIDGYTTTIKGLTETNSDGKEVTAKDVIIYSLKKDIIDEAIVATAKSFVTKERYENYENDTQPEIKETGTYIENLYIKNKITIKESRVPVDQKIYETSEDLTKFLLFGSNNKQQEYTVKEGDTIEDVSFNNKISTEEFLIANTQFKDKNSLLFPGQVVKLGIMNPQFDLIEEVHSVTDVDVNYETETRYDNEKRVGYSAVEQAGVKGKNRVTQKIQKVNGETTNIVPVSTQKLKEPVKEIIVKGGKKDYYGYGGSGFGGVVATKGEWGWPATCTSVSSHFGYRWGTLHDGTDIAGCGYGSNIFAAQAGTVVKASYKYDNGIYVIIDHHNGYYSLYAHLAAYTVREGQTVTKGQVIGTMGRTGFATGVHLHYAIWYGYPYYGGRVYNAMSFY
ncbi:MAG: peptidoglycan DD-metalloendopeptidase family protein [Bacilli bacterium]|nr:peptidoglycan DD-metalloendopeptidase family protein [Bacilli bacterium]